MDFDNLKLYIIDKLTKELDVSLYYHNVDHTLDVLKQCEEIGSEMGVSDEDMLLLRTAALFHDVGYVWVRAQHEQRSVAYAKNELPNWGYSSNQIEVISKMILTTRIPQSASTELEQILCDADLSYLGTNAFVSRGNDLYKEFLEAGVVSSIEEWDAMQISFLKSHSYCTSIAKERYNSVKQENLNKLIRSKQ